MKVAIAASACCCTCSTLRAQSDARSDTVLKLTEGKREVLVDALDDPVVQGVSCYVSLARAVAPRRTRR